MGNFILNNANSNYAFLDSIESPELTLKDKTLKEAIFKATEKIDAIPRLKYNTTTHQLELDLDFVNKLRNLIESENDFTSKSRAQDADYYATNMESDLLNATNLSDVEEATEIYPAYGGLTNGGENPNGLFTSLRSSSFVFNFEKSYVPTPKRINFVRKLYSLQAKPLNVNADGVFYYRSDFKFDYYANLDSFPTTGNLEYWYVDISNAESVYFWDGTSYVSSTQDTNEQGKVRFIDSVANFNTTDTLFRTEDLYIDRSTGQAYVYTTSYSKINCFNEYGQLIIDMSDRVLEKTLYDTLDVESGISSVNRNNPDNFFQSNTIFYNYRKNNIQVGNTVGLFDTVSSLEVARELSIFTTLKENGKIPSNAVYDDYNFAYTGFDLNELLFQVHYTPIPVSTRVTIDRQDVDDIDRYSTILNNQGERIIELNNVLDNMQGKINKIGNSELKVSQRVTNINQLFSTGDYTADGFVVTNRELIFYRDYIDVKYEATKNYNRLSKFIGVQSEVRQYEMGENNTLQRKLMYDEYVEVNAYKLNNAPIGINTSNFIKPLGANAFISTFDINNIYQPVRGGIVSTDEIDENLLTGFGSNGGGNALVFEMQLPSNKSAGEIITEKSSSIWGLKQRATNYQPYTDVVGKFEGLSIRLFDQLNIPYATKEEYLDKGDAVPSTDESYINNEYFGNGSTSLFSVSKDSREEIGFTFSLKTISKDYNKVLLGNKLFRRNALVSEISPPNVVLHTYSTKVFDRSTTKAIPSGGTSHTLVANIDYANQRIVVNNDLSAYQSWCLADENGDILIAVNQGDDELNTLVFDFTNKRSDINYNY